MGKSQRGGKAGCRFQQRRGFCYVEPATNATTGTEQLISYSWVVCTVNDTCVSVVSFTSRSARLGACI
jgi:hypothetical protein